MLRLKFHNACPPGGFSYKDRQTGWNSHGWSLKAVGAAWFTEQLKRGVKTTIEHSIADVEHYMCKTLVESHPNWTEWVVCDSEYEALAPLDDFDRESSSPRYDGRFVVVFPYCAKDGHMAVKSMKWICEITEDCKHDLILSHDNGTPRDITYQLHDIAKTTFKAISTFQYNGPRGGQWPPTVAFREAAKHMQEVGKPWLWLEYDCIPLKPHWLDALQKAYSDSGKAFAGPIVADMGHCNGTAIYPSNTPGRIPRALSLIRTAWDVTMKGEMITDCHDLQPLWYHAWGVYNGRLHPYLGEPPQFPPGTPLVDQIPKESVIFHRDKGVQLPERLRERRLVTA